MAKEFKQSNVEGVMWERCSRIMVTNPINDRPKISFGRQQAVTTNDQTVVVSRSGTSGASCSKYFNQGETFKLYNPETGEPTGDVMTHEQAYAILYSMYIDTATKADHLVAIGQASESADVVVPDNYEILP